MFTESLVWTLLWFKQGSQASKNLPTKNMAQFMSIEWSKWKQVGRGMEGNAVRGYSVLLCRSTHLMEVWLIQSFKKCISLDECRDGRNKSGNEPGSFTVTAAIKL